MALKAIDPSLRRDLVLSVKAGGSSRPLSPVEVAEALETTLQAGATLSDIAMDLLMESTSTLREILRLLRLAPSVRHLVVWGRSASALSMTTASLIGRVSATSDQEGLAKAVLADRLTASEVREVVELIQRGQTREAALASVLGRRRQIDQRFVLMGAVADAVRAPLETMAQSPRNELLREVLAATYAALSNANVSLGIQHFTIVAGIPFSEIDPVGGAESIESTINAELRRRVT